MTPQEFDKLVVKVRFWLTYALYFNYIIVCQLLSQSSLTLSADFISVDPRYMQLITCKPLNCLVKCKLIIT